MKPHVCHLTILNPARHPRIFHKWALSLLALGCRVTVIGIDGAPAPYEAQGIRIVPIAPFPRLSLRRLALPHQIEAMARASGADAFVLHSPELLGLGRRLHRQGAAIAYDMHEDYYETLRSAPHYPPLLRQVLATAVRRAERRALGWLSAVSYAEACYDDLLRAGPKKFLLPNRFSIAAASAASGPLPAFAEGPFWLYTGTLAADWGIFRSIRLWAETFPLRPMPLVMAGHAPIPSVLARIEAEVARLGLAAHFHLIGGRNPAPYPLITALIRRCYAGLGLYAPLPHLREKIPSKFYEYAALARPLVHPAVSEAWRAFASEWGLGPAHEEGRPAERLLAELDAWHRNPPPLLRPPLCWESQEALLAAWLERMQRPSP
jgi:glycosyltransferase involved in cell wall biosynthesis